MDLIELIGRLVFAAMFVNSGSKHLTQREAMTAYARGMRAPAPGILVPATGVMLVDCVVEKKQ